MIEPFKIIFPGSPVGYVPLEYSETTKKNHPDRNYVTWVKVARELAKAAYEQHGSRDIYEAESIGVEIVAFHKPWKNFGKTKMRMVRTDELRPHISPNLFNIEGAIYDACEGIVFRDKIQIVRVYQNKRFAFNHDETRTEVIFSRWPR